jgi:hypothetical protein
VRIRSPTAPRDSPTAIEGAVACSDSPGHSSMLVAFRPEGRWARRGHSPFVRPGHLPGASTSPALFRHESAAAETRLKTVAPASYCLPWPRSRYEDELSRCAARGASMKTPQCVGAGVLARQSARAREETLPAPTAVATTSTTSTTSTTEIATITAPNRARAPARMRWQTASKIGSDA